MRKIILRWWYRRRASANLHKSIKCSMRAEKAVEQARQYKIKDLAYQLKLSSLDEEPA